MSGDTRRVTGPPRGSSICHRPPRGSSETQAGSASCLQALWGQRFLRVSSKINRGVYGMRGGIFAAFSLVSPRLKALKFRRPRWRITGCGIPGKSRGWGRGKEGSGCFRGICLFLQHSLALQLIKFMGNPYFLRQPHLAGASLQLWEEQAKIKWIRSICPCNKPGQKGPNSQKIPNQSTITPSLGYSSGILDSPWHIPCPQPRQLQFPPVNSVQNIHLREQHNYLWERSVDGWKF